MIRNMAFLFIWWLTSALFTLVGLPLTRKLFRQWPDQGYPLARTLGLVIVSYLAWLGGLIKFIPFTTFSLVFITIIVGLGLNLKLKSGQRLTKVQFKNILFQETFFVLIFLVLSFIRAHEPNIHGLEKFMDFGFVNAILKSRYFPPQDMWFAGSNINYYYFGHLITAVLIKISRVPPEIGYNLMIATIGALCFTSVTSIAAYLTQWLTPHTKRSLVWGLVSGILVTFGGNLQIIYHWFKNRSLKAYWYADATRFITEKFGAADNTIHEFPGYSFIVADLHGHLNNLPLVLVLFGLIVSIVTAKKIRLKSSFPILALFGFLAGIGFTTNAWDLPIYYLFLGLGFLTKFWSAKKPFGWIKPTFILLLPALLATLTTITPFLHQFESITQGIALVDFQSPLWMLVYLWGLPLVTCAVIGWLWPRLKNDHKRFLVAVLTGAWLLIIIPEFIRVRDIYHIRHQRANTMFKLTYQAFIVFYLFIGPVWRRLLAVRSQLAAKALGLVMLVFITISLSYPYHGFKSYYFSSPNPDLNLNGMKFLTHYYPDDEKAIRWLQTNVDDQSVILEAVGESYSDFARVSAFTGLPTIVGWPVHEWLWRADSVTPYERQKEVELMYLQPELPTVKTLFEKYRVKRIFVGQLERQAYPKLNEEYFQQEAASIHRFGQTVVYEL